jgi:hypothetical protein
MIVLDCESLDSTYNSIQSVLGLTREAIQCVFASLDVERFYAENRNYPHDAPHLLMEKIKSASSSQIKFDAVCWFHLSRVLSPNTFENGILPLGDQVSAIWESLRSLVGTWVSDKDWNRFRNNMGASHSAFLYHMKVNDRDHWGPYGVLVRDVGLCPNEIGNHDYLGVPEIIEDICLCFAEQYNFDLLSAFLQNSRPCIVKFIDEQSHTRCLPPALYYLYSRFWAKPLSLSCNTCFDGGGKVIPAEKIQQVEFPEYPNREIVVNSYS